MSAVEGAAGHSHPSALRVQATTATDSEAVRQLADLNELVARLLPRLEGSGQMPTPQPVDGQTRRAWEVSTAQIRQQHDALALQMSRIMAAERPAVAAPEVGAVTFETVGSGEDQLAARVYRPRGDGPFGALIVLHGGAWWMGGGSVGFELNDRFCRRVCAEGGVLVLNLDYRLAPEHSYLSQVEDARAALAWLREDVAGIGVDPGRIGFLGMSSGASIVAATTLQLRDEDTDAVACQVLMHPSLDMTASSPRWQANPEQRSGALAVRALCLRDLDAGDPRVSPLLATNHSGLPPAVIVIATEDVLHDDGALYADRLAAAGVEVDLHELVMTHVGGTPEVDDILERAVIAGVRRHLVPE